MKKLKVMSVVGTRPEIIRLSRVLAALDRYCDHVLVHTGQNYDYELNQVFFDDLGLSAPARHLGVGSGSHGEMTGKIMIEFEKRANSFRDGEDQMLVGKG